MKSWTQPICPSCFAAYQLGASQSPHREPVRLIDEHEPCLVCGNDNDGIYVRVDPELTDGLKYAKRSND